MGNSIANPNRNVANVGLVALDIDGTLLAPGVHHLAVPDARITAAVAQLQQSGVVVVLATGRMFPGTAYIAKHLGISQPLICQQGASIHQLNGDLVTRFAIDPKIAREIAELAIEEGLPYAWFDAQRYLVSETSPAAQYFADVSGVTVEQHKEPLNSGLTATGVDIISTPERSGDIYRRLAKRYGDQIELLDFTGVTAAHSKDANKGKALKILAQEFGVAQAQVVAIGDSLNDVSMLEWAGLGASPGHCDSHARAATDRVLPGEGVEGIAGVAALLEELAG